MIEFWIKIHHKNFEFMF